MVAVQKDLVDMSVIELKNELKARNEGLGGIKPCLRRRLHAAIMQDIWAGARPTERKRAWTTAERPRERAGGRAAESEALSGPSEELSPPVGKF